MFEMGQYPFDAYEACDRTALECIDASEVHIGANKTRYFEVPMSDRKEPVPIIKEEKRDKKTKLSRKTAAGGDPPVKEILEQETEKSTDRTDSSETITIEADGIKLVIGSNVGEEALRNILKVVQRHA